MINAHVCEPSEVTKEPGTDQPQQRSHIHL